jgi:hypothetical protein
MSTPLPTTDVLTFDLEPWLERNGSVTTVVLPTPSATDEARDRVRLEWKNARNEVAADAPAESLAALDTELEEPGVHAGGNSLLLFARGDQVAAIPMSDEVPTAWASTGVFPRLSPVLLARQSTVPHLVVVADRVGADILVVGPEGAARDETVDGEVHHIARSAPGGWSQRRFQQRAENTWERNAADVAEEVDGLRRQVGARLVVVVGDERAVQFLRDQASPELLEVLQVVDGAGRNDEDPFDAVATDVHRLVATVVAEDTLAVLERFGTARGRGECADGPVQTMEMLSQGRVEMLLVSNDPDDERTAFVDLESGQISPDAQPLQDLDLQPVEARLVDAALWGALRTGAGVRFVPGHGEHVPRAGMGAILRG